MKNGCYTDTGFCAKNGIGIHVQADVSVQDGRMTKIVFASKQSIPKLLNLVQENLVPRIIERQSLAVDAVASATITSMAALEAVEKCVAQAGGDMDVWRQPCGEIVYSHENFEEYDCDILVIGAGGAGIAAAVYAAEAGKKVIVVEKTAACGGQTMLANCMLACEHPLQKAAGVYTSRQDVFSEIMEWNHWMGNSRVASCFVNHTAATVDWLRERGVPIVYRGSEQESHKYDTALHFDCDDEGKYKFLSTLLARVPQNGGRIFFETMAEKLIRTSDGRICGAWALRKGKGYIKISAGAVVVATGGYNANTAMSARYFKNSCPYVEAGSVYTGDGVRMCWDAGADEFGLGVRILHCTHADRDLVPLTKNGVPAAAQFCRMPALMLVNCRGKRFMNEYKLQDSASCAASVVAQGDGGYYWAVADQSIIDRLHDEGAASLGITWAPGGPGGDYLVPGFFNNIYEDIEEAISVGLIFRADTPEALAELIGMDPTAFRMELNRYNSFCDEGCDRDFYKQPKLLHKLSHGPYYAEKSMATSLGSIGGVRIDENCRCVGADMRVIPGLYCCGADAGALWPIGYGIMEGGTCAWAYNSGLIAAEHVISYLDGLIMEK